MDSNNRSNKDFIADMVNKSHHAGKVYRLPCVSRMSSPMTKSQLKAWTSAFLALFNENEQVNVKHTMFLWRYEDDMDAGAVRNGIPGDANDVKWLFDNSRLLKQDFKPELTETEMQIIDNAAKIDFPENYPAKPEPTSNCSKCNTKHHGSCNSVIAVYDKVVKKITGNQFLTAQKLFEGGENFPEKKQQNLTRLRKVMEGFKSHMSNYINLDLLPQFEDGQYHTWKILMQAIYRIYKIEESQENMAQIFKNIKNVASAADKSTETKIGMLRDILRRVQIRGKENYFISKDHEHGREVQLSDEHYTPQVNLLLSYILAEENIDFKKLDELQLAFERKIESGWSYQKWHQTRPELYKLMDSMQKSSKSTLGGALCSIKDGQPPEMNFEDEAVADKLEKLQLEINQMRRGQWQNSNRLKSWNGQGSRKEANGYQKSNWKPNPSKEYQSGNKLKSQLCTHCSHHAGSIIYHANAQPGGGDSCFYDNRGTKRGTTSFNNRVATLGAAAESTDEPNEVDLRQYYQDRLQALENIPADE